MTFKLVVNEDTVHEFDVPHELVEKIILEGPAGGNGEIPVKFHDDQVNIRLQIKSEDNLEVIEWRARTVSEEHRKEANKYLTPAAIGKELAPTTVYGLPLTDEDSEPKASEEAKKSQEEAKKASSSTSKK